MDKVSVYCLDPLNFRCFYNLTSALLRTAIRFIIGIQNLIFVGFNYIGLSFSLANFISFILFRPCSVKCFLSLMIEATNLKSSKSFCLTPNIVEKRYYFFNYVTKLSNMKIYNIISNR